MRYFIGIPVTFNKELLRFRDYYDPRAAVLEPHITIIPPFEEQKLTDAYSKHIESVTQRNPQTLLYTDGYHITDKGHIFYIFDEKGNTFLQKLYQELSAPLKPYERESQFFPHIMLGKINIEWIDERFEQEISKLCVRQTVPVIILRLYKSVGKGEKRIVIKDFNLC